VDLVREQGAEPRRGIPGRLRYETDDAHGDSAMNQSSTTPFT
jgi:hypothetical protein